MSENNEVNMSETVTMTMAELQQRIQQALTDSKLEVLEKSFEIFQKTEQATLREIFDKLRELGDHVTGWPLRLNECASGVDEDLKQYMDQHYMKIETANGRFNSMEERVDHGLKSIKLWIVATVGGFTAAGVVILWVLDLFQKAAP